MPSQPNGDVPRLINNPLVWMAKKERGGGRTQKLCVVANIFFVVNQSDMLPSFDSFRRLL